MARPPWVLFPHEEEEAAPVARARPLPDLRGAVIGLLDNGKPGARGVLHEVGDLLRERHGVGRTVIVSKPSAGRPVDDGMVEKLRQEVNGVVTGVGD